MVFWFGSARMESLTEYLHEPFAQIEERRGGRGRGHQGPYTTAVYEIRRELHKRRAPELRTAKTSTVPSGRRCLDEITTNGR